MTDALPVDAPPGPGDTFIELRGGVPYIGTQPVSASVDVTDVLTVAASDHFNPDELRDPKTGKWVRDPAGRFLDEAAKSLGYQERISHKGHSIDRTKAGFTVKLKGGEKHSYEHAGDAAEAVRRGRHLNDSELKGGESHLGGKPGAGKLEPPKPKPGKGPETGGIKWTADGASYHQGTDAAGNKYVLKYAPGGGWDVHEQPKGAAHGRVLGEKIGHGKNAAEAKRIAEAHTAGGKAGHHKVEPPKPEPGNKLPDGYTTHQGQNQTTIIRDASGQDVATVLIKVQRDPRSGVVSRRWGYALSGGRGEHQKPYATQAEAIKQAVAHHERLRKPTEPPKGPLKPKPDPVQGLSGKSRDGKASPLEREFFLEHHDHSGRTTGFTVYDRGELKTQQNLEMYRAVPQEMRQQLAAHDAEIYMGTRPVTEMDDLHNLTDEQPQGYSKGDTFAKVAAMVQMRSTAGNRSRHPVVAIGGGDRTYGSGSVNVSAHEAAHALDFTSRLPSQSPEFQRIYKSVKGNFTINPYYVQKGNGPAGAMEFFAEAFAAWAENRDKITNKAILAMRIMGAVGARPGHTTGSSQDAMEKLGRKLNAYFDEFYQSFIKEGH